jgi:hypothetical protein
MLTPTWPASLNFAAPIHCDHPSAGMSYTTRSGVEGSVSASMKYVPGFSGLKCSSDMTSWIEGVELGAGAEVGVNIGLVAGVGGELSVGFAVSPGPELPHPDATLMMIAATRRRFAAEPAATVERSVVTARRARSLPCRRTLRR